MSHLLNKDTGLPEIPVGSMPIRDVGGAGAATITTNTVAVAGNFSAITVIADAVFTSLNRANTNGSFGSVAVPAGITIFGKISGYQLASGAVIAYEG